LLLEITRRILGIGGADAGADDRTWCRSDAVAAAAAHRGTERCPETSAKESAADSLGIDLIGQRGGLCIGKLPAHLIIIIRLRHRAGARREHRQNRAYKPFGD
jgi:hypothetical protein